MTRRKILTFPDPQLREVAKEVTEFNSDLKSLAEDLIETMYEFKGIGLAAVQIGVNKRVIVADVSEEKKEPFIFINPTIKILNEDEKGGYDEGCLSIPGFYEEVVLTTQVEIIFQNLSGKKEEIIPE